MNARSFVCGLRAGSLSRRATGAAAILCLTTVPAQAQDSGQPPSATPTAGEPVLAIELNQSTYRPNQQLTLGVSVQNPGGGPICDFFVGIVLPDGTTAVSVRLGAQPVFGSLANLRSLVPVAARISLASGFAVSQTLFDYTFNGSEPSGNYLVYFAAVRTGALADGVLGAGDLLALQTTSFTVASGGILLPGAPTTPAIQSVHLFNVSTGVAESEIAIDAAGREIARTQIEIAFEQNATVAQVNDVLTSIHGLIVSMLPKVLIVLVQIPDPGSLAALEQIKSQVESKPGVREVVLQTFPETDALPDNIPPSSSSLDKIDHLLALRAHAAWNVARALDGPGVQRPLVIVADEFGSGAPGLQFSADTDPGDFGSGDPDEHGYHVLGIITATFGGSGTDEDLATGLLPGLTRVRVVDRLALPKAKRAFGDIENAIVERLKKHQGNAVLNTSLGFHCRTVATAAANCEPLNAAQNARLWLEKIRSPEFVDTAGVGLEPQFVHLTSAGNVSEAGDFDTTFNSPFTAAALQSGLSRDGVAIPNATNVLVVENRLNTATEPFLPSCLSLFSKRPGMVSAIGTDVWSTTGPFFGGANKSGVSMAAPAATALAAYVWALRPDLSNRQVMQILTTQARSGAAPSSDPLCDITAPAPVLDAYASVLATDDSLANAPVRNVLFDVTNAAGSGPDGSFTEHDLSEFLRAFTLAAGALDYSRFDVNGDGRTGGSTGDRFDLDFDRFYQNAIRVTENISRRVDENAATDLDVLCHYAHTPLFTGNRTERDRILAGLCRQGPTSGSLGIVTRPDQPTIITATLGESDNFITITRPIGDVAGLVNEVQVALASFTELRSVGFNLDVPISLSIDLSRFNVLGSVGVVAACSAGGTGGSTLNVQFGDTAGAGIRACAPTTVTAQFSNLGGLGIEELKSGTVSVTASTVGGGDVRIIRCDNGAIDAQLPGTIRDLIVGSSFFSDQGNNQCQVNIGGAQVTRNLGIERNVNSPLGTITAGDLRELAIRSNTGSTFTLDAGDIVPTVGRPGDAFIEHNVGIPLTALNFGNVAGTLTIRNNRGFTDTQAHAFADARQVGAKVISGNQP